MTQTSLRRLWKTPILLLLLLVITASSVFNALAPMLASAATTPSPAEIKAAKFEWVNVATIKATIGGQTYNFVRSSPGTYKIQNYPCPTGQLKDVDGKQGSFDMDYIPAGNTTAACVNVAGANGNTFPITDPMAGVGGLGIGSGLQSSAFTISNDRTKITPVPGGGGEDLGDFSQSSEHSNLFTRNNETGQLCQDVIKVDVTNKTYTVYELTSKKDDSGGNPPADIYAKGCYLVKTDNQDYLFSTIAIPLAGAEGLTQKQLDDSSAGGGGGASTTGDETGELGCDWQLTNALSWILCPVINLFSGMATLLDNIITSQMTVDANQIFCTSANTSAKTQKNCDAYYAAWSSFRNIALGLLVVVGLIILIAQALGVELLDAYTIRKTLPRLLFAVVFITLSWPLMLFAVQLTNDLGFAVRHLIYAPFAQIGIDVQFGSGAWQSITGSIAGAIGAGGAALWFVGGGYAILLSFAGTAALAAFIAIAVLVLRQIAIILLILIAPIAILTFVLPNTQKMYHFWWDSFSKALLMFPLIAAFIAVGHVFAGIALSNTNVINQFIGFIAYFAPYFLIPLTFKFAGGLVRQLGNFANDRGRGGFDRLVKGRQATRQQMGQDFKSGQALRRLGPGRPGGAIGKINTGMTTAAKLGSAGIRPSMWKENVRQAVKAGDIRGASKELLNDDSWGLVRGNDSLTEALERNDFNVDKARQTLMDDYDFDDPGAKQAISSWVNASRELRKKGYSERAIQWGTVLQGLGSSTAHTSQADFTGPGKTGEYIGGSNIAATIQRLSGGDANVQAQMVASMMDATQDRPELGASFTEWYGAVRNIETASSIKDPNARKQAIENSGKALRRTAIYKKGIGVVFGSGHTAKNLAPEYEEMVTEAYRAKQEAQLTGSAVVQRYNDKTHALGPVTISKQEAEDHYLQMMAEMAAAQSNAANLPLEKRPIIGAMIDRELQPAQGDQKAVIVQDELNQLRSDPRFQKYVSDYYSMMQRQREEAGKDATLDPGAAASGAPKPTGTPKGPGSPPSGGGFGGIG